MDSRVAYSGTRQSRAALSPLAGLEFLHEPQTNHVLFSSEAKISNVAIKSLSAMAKQWAVYLSL